MFSIDVSIIFTCRSVCHNRKHASSLFKAGDAILKERTRGHFTTIRLAILNISNSANEVATHCNETETQLTSLCMNLAAFVAELLALSSTRGFASFWHRTSEPRNSSAAAVWSKAMGLSNLLNTADDYTAPPAPGVTPEPTSTDHLNPSLATWITGVLLSTLSPSGSQCPQCAPLPKAACVAIVSHLLQSWARGLKSASTPLKFICAVVTSGIIQQGISELDFMQNHLGAVQIPTNTSARDKATNDSIVRRIHRTRCVWCGEKAQLSRLPRAICRL